MKPDNQIEDEAIDFFIDENLPPDDQEYLMDAIEIDPKLSEIFDRVILRAIEVTKEGVINGPGDGTSDSIPARLSDGEFVFSKIAVDNIGIDKLTAMHDQARAQGNVNPQMEEESPENLINLEERIQKLEGGYV